MIPTSPNLSSPKLAKGRRQTKKLVAPYLHHLPYLPKGTTSPGLVNAGDYGVDNLDASKDTSGEVLRSKRSPEIVPRSIVLRKLPQPTVHDDLKPSKITQIRVANLLQRRDTNPSNGKVVNGNLMELLPKMKARNLKDRIVLLKNAASQMNPPDEDKPEAITDSVKKAKSKNVVPDLALDKKSSSPDFAGVLEDFLFAKKKNKLCHIEKPLEPTPAIPRVSLLSPDSAIQKKDKAIAKIRTQMISQVKTDFKESICIGSPTQSPLTKSGTHFRTSLTKLRTEQEISQDIENLVCHTRPHHTRQSSLVQTSMMIGDNTLDSPVKLYSRGSMKNLTTYDKAINIEISQPKSSNYIPKGFKSGKPSLDIEKMTISVINPQQTPSHQEIKFLHSSQLFEKNYSELNLKLLRSPKLGSTDHLKTGVTTTCSSSKTRGSLERQKIPEEDLDLFDLISSIRDSSSKRNTDSKKERDLIVNGYRQ